MRLKQGLFAVLAGLWIFFFIADSLARAVSCCALLKRVAFFAFIRKAIETLKGLSLFLLIIGNIILILRLFDPKTGRRATTGKL